AEASVLDHDGLRALEQVGRDAVGGVLPPDRDERAGASAAVERHPRDGIVLIASTDDHDKRSVRRPPDRPRAAHRELPVRGRVARRWATSWPFGLSGRCAGAALVGGALESATGG